METKTEVIAAKPAANLHHCADCTHWQPALTYFGEPTGQGGCRFSPARNRKGSLLRDCEKYCENQPLEGRNPQTVSEPISKSKLSARSETMGIPENQAAEHQAKELESLIHFWRDALAECRLLMSPSTVYLVEQTIKRLETLAHLTSDGIFVTRLNNGDWMAGKATYIYQIDITEDHYADPNLSISTDLASAVEAAGKKLRRSADDNAD